MNLKNLPRSVVIIIVLVLAVLFGVGTCVNSNKQDVSKNLLNPPAPVIIKPTPPANPAKDPVPTGLLITTAPNCPPVAITDVWGVLATPSKNVVDGLELPPPTDVPSTKRYVIIQAKSAGPVKWLISSKLGQPIETVESKITNSVMIFLNGTEDTIAVLAYTSNQNLPSETAITLINVKSDQPTTPVTPTPVTPPTPTTGPITPQPSVLPDKVSKLHVTFYIDKSQTTQLIDGIINDPDLNKWLVTAGHKVHELDTKASLSSFGLDNYLKNKYTPLLILQAQGETGITEGTLINNGIVPLISVQNVKTVVSSHTK